MKNMQIKRILSTVLLLSLTVAVIISAGTALAKYVFSGTVGTFNLTVVPKIPAMTIEAMAEELNLNLTRVVYDYWDNGYTDTSVTNPVTISEEDWNEEDSRVYNTSSENIRMFAREHETGKHTVYILSDQEIYAPKNSENLFSGVTNEIFKSNITEIQLHNFHFQEGTYVKDIITGCDELITIDVSGVDFTPTTNTPNGSNYYSPFTNCAKVTTVDLSNTKWDSSALFRRAVVSLKSIECVDFTDIYTNGLTDFSQMFYICDKLTTITGIADLDIASVSKMSLMFSGCKNLSDETLTEFASLLENANKLTTIGYAFQNCDKLSANTLALILSSLSDKPVTNYEAAFTNCTHLTGEIDLSEITLSAATNLKHMFSMAENITSIKMFKANNTANMSNIFKNCYALQSVDFSGSDFSNTTLDDTSFSGCSKLKYLNLSNTTWGTGGIPKISADTNSHIIEEINITGINTEKATDFVESFANMNELKKIIGIEHLDVSNVTNMNDMFKNCQSLDAEYFMKFGECLAQGNQVDKIALAFFKCYKLDLNAFNAIINGLSKSSSKISNLQQAFQYCSGISGAVDLTPLNLTGVYGNYGKGLQETFHSCSGITSITFPETSGGFKSLLRTFNGCSALTTIDVSRINTSAVATMEGMFRNCSALITVYVGNGWSTASVTTSADMFTGCTKLVGGMGTAYSSSHTDQEYARVDEGPDSEKPGYFTHIKDKTAYNNRMATMLNSIVDYNNHYDSLLSQLEEEHPDIYAEMMEELAPFEGVDKNTYNNGQEPTVLDSIHDIRGKYLHKAYPELSLPTPAGYLMVTYVYDVRGVFFTKASEKKCSGSQFLIAVDAFASGGVQLLCDEPGFKESYLNFAVDDTRFAEVIVPADMSGFFQNWPMLEEVSFAVPVHGAEDVNNMFAGCTALKTVDLRGLDFSAVTNVTGMFSGCNNLESIDVTGLNLTVEDLNQMLQGCESGSLTIVGAPDGYVWN